MENRQTAIHRPLSIGMIGRQDRFYNMPTSGSSDMVMKVLGAGTNIATLPQSTKRVSHSQQLTVRESGKKRQLISKTDSTETIIEIGDIEKLIGSNKTAKKMFALSLIKINEQAYDYKAGSLYKDAISFPLQELVDIGYYSSLRTARRGFMQAIDTLTSLKLKAVVKRGKNTYTTAPDEGEGEGIRVMFTGGTIDNNQCTIELNYKINWQPLFQYFTIMPKWAFKLGNRPFDMLNAIMYLARQNTKQIKEKGYFTIGFRTIQQRLELPSEDNCINPTRDIRQPIEDCINVINEQLQEEAGADTPELTIEPVFDMRANIRDYLDNGYLKISLKGEYAEPFIEQSKKRSRQIEQKTNRQQAIVDKAKEKAIQKKLEQELDTIKISGI